MNTLLKGRRTGFQALRVANDIDGYENIDDFWNAEEVESITPARMITSKSPRSSILSVPTESFDYDTSNSISESEEESYDESKLNTPASILSKRSPVGSNVNRRSSATSNTSLGSTLPLEDSMMDESGIISENGFESNNSSTVSVKSNNKNIKNKKASSPFSLQESPVQVISPIDSDEYPPKKRVENELLSPVNKKNNKITAPSSSSSRDGAKGRIGYNNRNDDDDDDDDNADFGDDYEYGGDDNIYNDRDDNNYNDFEPSSSKRTPKSTNSNKNSDSVGNRRVSFGKDTKKNTVSSHKTPQSRRSSIDSDDTTPDSVNNSRYSIGTTPGSNEFPRGRTMVDETYNGGDKGDESDDNMLTDSDLDSDEGVTDKSGFTDDLSFLDDKKKRNRDVGSYEESSSEDEISEEDSDGLRRSRRATKGKKFAFWKNERPIYDKGKLIGELLADPTPKKKKVFKKKLIKNNSSKTKFNQMKDSDDELVEQDHSINLPNYTYINSNKGGSRVVWDDINQNTGLLPILSYSDTRVFHQLPKSGVRLPGKDILALASSTFTNQEIPGVMSAWTSGVIDLPAGGIKDAEGVGECSQVFFISDCQDNALELGIASTKEMMWNDKTAIRQVLKSGDSFHIPAGNIYRIENHSKYKKCTIFYTIISPIEQILVESSSRGYTEIDA